MNEVYISKKLQSWIDKLVDLFCLEDNIPIVILHPKMENIKGETWFATPKSNAMVHIGTKGGVRLSTLVHEFIHAMGYHHEWEINGWANFRHVHYSFNSFPNRDTYTPLIVKDLCGKKELII